MTPSARGRDLENRTVKWLETVGYRAERVSRTGLRVGGDLFGCIDVVALNEEGPLLIQVTTKNHASHRRRKIRDAKLPWPVRLFLWFKHKNRWTFTSEEVAPTALFLFEDCDCVGHNEAAESGVGSTPPGLTETRLNGGENG